MASKKSAKQATKQRDESEDDVSEPEIEELENRSEVTKSGTAGTKRAAVAGDAITKLAVVIDKMKASSRKNDLINAFNKVSIGYDQVIISYVGKREALKSANNVIVALRDSLETMEKGSADALEKVLSQRRGCRCHIAKDKGSRAGRCETCACARANLKCNKELYACSCGPDCTRPEDKQKEVDRIVKKRVGILKKKKNPSLEEALAELGFGKNEAEEEEASSPDEDERKSAAAAAPKKKGKPSSKASSKASSRSASRSASKKKDESESDEEEKSKKKGSKKK